MEFFKNMRDVIHGLTHETRTVLAAVSMGALILLFFVVWNAAVPLRLVSLSPIPPGASAPESFMPTQVTMAGPYEPVPAGGSEIASVSSPSQDALTPVAGVAETFANLGSFFASSASQNSDQSFASMFRAVGSLGIRVGRGALRVADVSGSAAVAGAAALQRIVAPLVAPNY